MKTPRMDQGGLLRSVVAASDAQEAATNIKSNMTVDLKNDNMAQVIAGGTADAAGTAGTAGASALKKRAKGGLSNQLGINV